MNGAQLFQDNEPITLLETTRSMIEILIPIIALLYLPVKNYLLLLQLIITNNNKNNSGINADNSRNKITLIP